MDRRRFSDIAHAGRRFWNPVDDAAVDAGLAQTVRAAGLKVARVLDIGCGRGEALARLVARTGAHGVGVDSSPHAVRLARERVREMTDGRVVVRETEFRAADYEPGSFDVALCVGATHACGGFGGTLAAMRAVLRPGGAALVGEGHWVREPDPEYLAYLGEAPGDTKPLPGLSAEASAAGFELFHLRDTPRAEFDRYEEHYARNIERFVAEHPDDPDAKPMLARIRPWRAAYERWGRTTMGFALFTLRNGTALK